MMVELSRDQLITVIDRIIGDYTAYGETNHDDWANINLQTLCDVVGYYVAEIYHISKNKKAVEYSIKESGEIASNFFEETIDYYEDWEKENEHKESD